MNIDQQNISLDLNKEEINQTFLSIIDLIKNGNYNEIGPTLTNIINQRIEKIGLDHSPEVQEKINNIRKVWNLILESLKDWTLDLQEFVTILSKLDWKMLALEIQIGNLEATQKSKIANLFEQFDTNEDGVLNNNGDLVA